MPSNITNISLSTVRAYQRCQQLYYYRYIQHIQRRGRSTPIELGSILHEYLELYYGALQQEVSAGDAHDMAQGATHMKWGPRLKQLSQAAFMAGAEDTAKDLLELERKFVRISDRYYRTRGMADADEVDVLFVEKRLDNNLTKTIRTRGYVDLVTQSRINGRVSLWEHKSTTNVPPAATRLRDLQTLLYGEQLGRFYETPIDSIIWNYIRTKEPHVPKLVYKGKKNERMEMGDMDTTWDVYVGTARLYNIDVVGAAEVYGELLNRLQDREHTVFFPRWEQVVVANGTVMLRDYLRTGLEIRRFEERVAGGQVQPIRTLDNACSFCEFNMLCLAAITGGDTEELIQLRYESTTRPERGPDAAKNAP